MRGSDEFDLLVTISAAELSALRRRCRFMEAALVQLLRGKSNLKEWFSAAELIEMQLPGLPMTTAGLTRLARAECWPVKSAGNKRLYHFSGLPRRAFETLIDLVVKDGASGNNYGEADAPPETETLISETEAKLPSLPAHHQDKMAATATTPPWVLPLLRIIRFEGKELETALALLPDRVKLKTACPSLAEARAILSELGLLTG